MKRRLRENIQIGDEVFAPRDEYYGTVLDIVDDMALVKGPMGKEYHNLKDLEKETSGYDEPYLNESRKKVVRLTESDLTRIIQRVVSEEQTTNQSPTGKIVPPPTLNKKTINPTIEIDCKNRVIRSSQLPKLDKDANLTIINHYCNK